MSKGATSSSLTYLTRFGLLFQIIWFWDLKSGTPFAVKVFGRNQCVKSVFEIAWSFFKLAFFCQGEQVQLNTISDFNPSGAGLYQDWDPGLRLGWRPRHPRRSEVVRSKHCHCRRHCWHRQDHGQGWISLIAETYIANSSVILHQSVLYKQLLNSNQLLW